MTTAFDPYGAEFGDWEDPEVHTDCTGCATCLPWEGRPHAVIRAQRKALVHRWRTVEGTELTPQEASRQDDDYWNNQR